MVQTVKKTISSQTQKELQVWNNAKEEKAVNLFTRGKQKTVTYINLKLKVEA